jgi:hypothetical protein
MDPTSAQTTSSNATPERPPRSLTGTVLRVLVWVVTIQVALQPVFAGPLLEGNATARDLHALNGVLIELTASFLLVTSILAWRPGRAPGRVAVAGTLVSVVLLAEAGSGHARAGDVAGALGVHVPLGVASMVLMLWLLVATRNLRTEAHPGAPRHR